VNFRLVTIDDIAQAYGRDPRTVQRWLRRLRRAGTAAPVLDLPTQGQYNKKLYNSADVERALLISGELLTPHWEYCAPPEQADRIKETQPA
jgi:transposase-like protein